MNAKISFQRAVVGFTLALCTMLSVVWLIQRSFLEQDMFVLAILIPFSWLLWLVEVFLATQIMKSSWKHVFYAVLLFSLACLTVTLSSVILYGSDAKLSIVKQANVEPLLNFLLFYASVLTLYKHLAIFSNVISHAPNLDSSLVSSLRPHILHVYQETIINARQSAKIANNTLFAMAIVTIIGLLLAIFAGHITVKDRNVFEHTTQLQQKVQRQEIELFKLAVLHKSIFDKTIEDKDCKKPDATDIQALRTKEQMAQEQMATQRYCKNLDELNRLKENRNEADKLQTGFLLKQDHVPNATTNYLISTGFLRLGIVLTMLLVLHMLFKIFLNASQSLATYRAIANSLLTSTLTHTLSLDELKKFHEVKFIDESHKPVEHIADILGKVVSAIKVK